MYFKKIKHPEYFQGNKKKNNYFEGWYYKLVTKDKKTSVAFIPGISINKKDPHAFIQVFISSNQKLMTHYLRYASDTFSYSHDQFMVQIDTQLFTKSQLDLNIQNDQISISGKIHIIDHIGLKTSLYAPNIMGPFAYIPFMECNHGVISMQAHLSGILRINGEKISFENGKSYMEKDWGKSFPKNYIWLQTNHFKDESTSLMFSYATIPFIGLSFKGLIVNLVYQQKEFRFSTYNMTRILKKEILDKSIYFILKKGSYSLHIKAHKDQEIELKSPSFGIMNKTIKEGLSGVVEIKLYKKNQLIYEDTGYQAGIEIMM
ncbi:MAG: tocopherol cyclase family protein [Acholeplasmataceae bacterium]|nr:tocopherol cyclase family protein [Acholeplasmataceae bacterium]